MGGLIDYLSTGENRAPKPQIPLLGKIPFLNRFFFNVRSSRPKEGLIILVTPHLIRGSEERSMAHPLAAPANLDNGWASDPSIEIEEVDVGRYVITWMPSGDEGYLKVGVDPR